MERGTLRYRFAALVGVLAFAAGARGATPVDGLYVAETVATTATGRTCEIGPPLAPAFALFAGTSPAPGVADAVALLRDDAGDVLALVPQAGSTFAAIDLGSGTKAGTVAFVAADDGVALDVDYRRPDPDCRVQGRVALRRSDDAAERARVVELAGAHAEAARARGLADAGKPREAVEARLAAERSFASVLGAGHRQAIEARARVAFLQWELDELPAARARNAASIAELTRLLGARTFPVFRARHQQALVVWYQGDVQAGERELRDIVAEYARLLDADDLERLYAQANLAALLVERGRLVEAESLLLDALARLERVAGPEHPRTLIAINNLAVAFDYGGRLDESLAMYETLLERYRRTVGRRHPHALLALMNLADTLGRLHRYDDAIVASNEAIAGLLEVFGPQHTDTLLARHNLAHQFAEAGRVDEAIALLRAVLADRSAHGNDRGREWLKGRTVLGALEVREGDVDAGLARMAAAYSSSRETLGDDNLTTLEIGARFGLVQREAGQLSAARATLTQVVTNVEAWREAAASTPSARRALFAPWVPAYKGLAFVHHALGDGSAAFEQVERSKARVLVELLAQRRGEVRDVLPSDAVDALSRLDQAISEVESRIAAADSPDARLPLERERAGFAEQARTLRAALRERHPRYAALSAPPLAAAGDAARSLPRGAVLASYLVDGDHVLAYTIDRTGKTAGYDLGTIPGLADSVHAYRALLTALPGSEPPALWKLPDGRFRIGLSAGPGAVRVRDAASIGRDLHARLVQPLQALSRAKRWVISPDGALALLPFEALPHRGRPLVATREISYTPSLTVYALTQQRARRYAALRDRRPLYAMGAAHYTGRAAGDTDSPVTLRAYDVLDLAWPPLPHSALEIRRVASLFPGRGQATVRTGDAATEAQLQRDDREGTLARHRYLLLSAHGYLSLKAPSLSAVVLGQRSPTAEADGYVTAAEWTGYTLQSDLIVVSACETGVGRVVEGEGVAGLPYALFAAGNRNALLTLWPVADRSTALFVSRFFAHLESGLDQSAALARTKREFAQGREFAAPFHWAPFALWGS